jgi:hypothetical protein
MVFQSAVMIAPVEETTMLSGNTDIPRDSSIVEALLFAQEFIIAAAQQLSACLGECGLRQGVVQSSRFCAAIDYDSEGKLDRCVISPEEMSIQTIHAMLEEVEP